MTDRSSPRQRPLFHDGPRWQQLDEQLQQQLVGRLADVCHGLVATPTQRAINQQEQSDDNRKD
jgi:hypothetical protein